jgi:hypothetical protein
MFQEVRETVWWNLLWLIFCLAASVYVLVTHQPSWFVLLAGIVTGMRIVTALVVIGPSHKVN